MPPRRRLRPSLREMVRGVAPLGGFCARTGDGEPGLTSIWQGYPRRHACIEAVDIHRTVRPKAHHLAIQAARQRQKTPALAAQYAARAGIEGTHDQAIRRCGLHQSRYMGFAKTHVPHLLTAVALNLVWWDAWRQGTPPAKTRRSPFAALREAVA